MKRAALVSLLAACGTSPTRGQLGTPQDPVPLPAEKGAYQVQTKIDLTVEAILPAQAELVVATLREFSMNPAHALIDLASKAGVPAVATIYNALPSALTDQLEGWINDEIAKVQIAGHPVTAFAGDIAGLADTALSSFAVDSTLAIGADTANHTLTALDLSPTGLALEVPIGGLAADLLTQTPSVLVAEGGAISFGDQHFGLEFGEYAWQGVEAACTATFGADIRTMLGKAIDCPALAHVIASKCLALVCVGHESELTSLCEGGLDAVVDLVHQQFDQINFDVLHFASGTGQLVDDDGDGVADRIVDGTWDAELNLGMGLRHAPGTFTASR